MADDLTDEITQAKDELGELVQQGRNALSVESLKKVADAHAPQEAKDALAQLQQAQGALNADGGPDLGALASMAANKDIGIGDKGQEFLKQFAQHANDTLDAKAAAAIPGLVVDSETKQVSFFGLFDVDAKYAQALVLAGNAFLLPLSGKLWEWGYKGAAHAGTHHFNLNEAARHRMGIAGAVVASGGITFWPDVNGFIQMEKRHKKQRGELVRKMSPILDELKGGHRLADLYSVKADDNEMLYNARKRMSLRQNAERLRAGVQVFERAPIMGVTLFHGIPKLSELQSGAMEDAIRSKVKNGAEEVKREMYRAMKAEAQMQAQELGIDYKDALKQVQELGVFTPGKAAAKKEGGFGNILDRFSDAGALITSFVVRGISQSVYGHATADMQAVSALDMVMELKKQLDDDAKSDMYVLPQKMKLNGAKADRNELPLDRYVAQIFLQHEKDSAGPDAKIPSRLHPRLLQISGKIADALRAGDLDGLALIRLVGERKIIRDGGRRIAGDDVVDGELRKLKHEMRNLDTTDDQQYFADASFSADELKQAWDAMDMQERSVFVGLVPAPVLESVGIKPRAVKLAQQQGANVFNLEVAHAVDNLLALGDKELNELGLTDAEIGAFKSASEAVQKEGSASLAPMLKDSAPDKTNLSHAVATSVVARYSKHQGRLMELLHTHAIDGGH